MLYVYCVLVGFDYEGYNLSVVLKDENEAKKVFEEKIKEKMYDTVLLEKHNVETGFIEKDYTVRHRS